MAAYKKPVDNNDDDESIINEIDIFLHKPLCNSYCTVMDLIQPELIFHPMKYMTTLVQIGYEPLPPQLTTSIFGKNQLKLPGFFTYMRYIANTDGFFGIYRGIKYNYAYLVTYKFVYVNVHQYQKQKFLASLKEDEKYKNVHNVALTISCNIGSTFASMAIAYPFHVMMVRSMAQFIGRESHYDSLWGAIYDIYYTGGVSGFYSGFVPYFIGECAMITLKASLLYIIHNHLSEYEFSQHTFVDSVVNIISRSLTYSFRVVSTVMACNGKSARSLAASAYTVPEYVNWIHCWRTLWARGEIKRGSALFWRRQPITSSILFPMQPFGKLPNKMF